MKRWAWRAVYVGLAYLGFVIALNTVWELSDPNFMVEEDPFG